MKALLTVLPLLAALLLAGCNYDVPLTAKPTQKIDVRLVGDWLGGEDGKDPMNVRQLDDATYVIAFDNDIYRVFHTDFAGTAFVSVESLQSGGDRGKYVYLTWMLSPDGRRLTVRSVSTKVVPEDTKGRAALQERIKSSLGHPDFLGEPLVFTRKAAK